MEAQTLQRMEPQAVQRTESAGDAFLSIIAAAARDPQVDTAKMQQLLEMRERIMKNEAEIAFNQAMTRLQPRLPAISKRGRIEFKGTVQSTFARYEDIDDAVRPLLCEEGFSLSFSSEITDKGVAYHGTLAHGLGHSKTVTMILPADTSGSKNAIQAIGSTVSYARRYLTCMVLNIVTKGQDDDGHSFGFVNDKQVNTITDMISACEITGDSLKRFLEFAGVDAIEKIRASDYERVMESLRKKLRTKQGAR